MNASSTSIRLAKNKNHLNATRLYTLESVVNIVAIHFLLAFLFMHCVPHSVVEILVTIYTAYMHTLTGLTLVRHVEGRDYAAIETNGSLQIGHSNLMWNFSHFENEFSNRLTHFKWAFDSSYQRPPHMPLMNAYFIMVLCKFIQTGWVKKDIYNYQQWVRVPSSGILLLPRYWFLVTI